MWKILLFFLLPSVLYGGVLTAPNNKDLNYKIFVIEKKLSNKKEKTIEEPKVSYYDRHLRLQEISEFSWRNSDYLMRDTLNVMIPLIWYSDRF